MRMINRMAVLALGFGLFALTAVGQDAKKPDAAKDAKKAEPPKDPKKQITAVVGADIYTVTRGVVRGGIVLIHQT